MDYSRILSEIKKEVIVYKSEGKVASYIPELSGVNPEKFGIHILTITGEEFSTGDFAENISIQSISKVFSLAHVISLIGEKIFDRVGVEPSGSPFNSIMQLEYEHGIPRNPFINSGALVVADALVSLLDSPKQDFLNFVRKMSCTEDIHFNEKVATSEKNSGFLNYSLANMLKSHGNLKNNVEDVLDFYFHQCSIEMSCKTLTYGFYPFANKGKGYNCKQHILTQSQVKRINALMLTCGFYDESGEFAFEVGLPGKSGVGGGIAAVHPGIFSVAVWSPRLNSRGNSVLGMKSLELLTSKTGLSIF